MNKRVTDADFTGPIFLLFLPLLIMLRGEDTKSRILLFSFSGLWLFWWPFTGMPRFFMPGLALLSILIAAAVTSESLKKIRGILILIILICGLDNFFNNLNIMNNADLWSCVIRGTSRAEYLKEARSTYPQPYYSAAEWINRNTPATSKILVIGDARAYYLRRPFFSASIFNTSPLISMTKECDTSEELRDMLLEKGITHIMANIGEMLRLKRRTILEQDKINLLNDFFLKYTEERFRDFRMQSEEPGWTMVYELVRTAPDKTLSKQNPLLMYSKFIW